MKCLYCNKKINEYTLYSLFIDEDLLCKKCRNKMKYHHQKFKINDLEVESFYDYDSLFKDILLQYKECYDEALKDVFLYRISDYLKIKYHGYRIAYVLSSKNKVHDRGFNHLKQIYNSLNFKEIKGLEMIEDLCQLNKDYSQRAKMLTNYKYCGNRLNKVLIVDDVFTTGSSLYGVYNALKGKCEKCKAVVLAKT